MSLFTDGVDEVKYWNDFMEDDFDYENDPCHNCTKDCVTCCNRPAER